MSLSQHKFDIQARKLASTTPTSPAYVFPVEEAEDEVLLEGGGCFRVALSKRTATRTLEIHDFDVTKQTINQFCPRTIWVVLESTTNKVSG
jgi:hypothetical protein